MILFLDDAGRRSKACTKAQPHRKWSVAEVSDIWESDNVILHYIAFPPSPSYTWWTVLTTRDTFVQNYKPMADRRSLLSRDYCSPRQTAFRVARPLNSGLESAPQSR